MGRGEHGWHWCRSTRGAGAIRATLGDTRWVPRLRRDFRLLLQPGADMFAPLGISHPLVATLAALVLGGLFGLLSSIVGAALTRTSVPEVS